MLFQSKPAMQLHVVIPGPPNSRKTNAIEALREITAYRERGVLVIEIPLVSIAERVGFIESMVGGLF